MALWLPSTGKLYLPPQKPVPRVLSTDEYITRTNVFFHAGSDRLLTVGHPYFPIPELNDPSKVKIPKVSACQYRVWRLKLPDPNKFALIDKDLYDPDKERLVWGLRGIEISRGGPLGIGCSGHPLFNKYADTENPFQYTEAEKDENRLNVTMEPKQTQLVIVGCTPATGSHWDKAAPCTEKPIEKGDCPLLQLSNSVIEDGDMIDTGLGAINFRDLSDDRASAPLDIIDSVCKYPDLIKMLKDVYGDSIFFYTIREQLYTRHMGSRAGTIGDKIPSDDTGAYFLQTKRDVENLLQKDLASHVYFSSPSGSLVSSDGQIFNKPYWLQRAQGPNNGIAWGNQLFVTLVDTTRNTNFTISVYNGDSSDFPNNYQYKASDFKQYLRHAEEYEIEIICQLCKVPLDADVLAHLNVMNPNILEDWQLAFVPPAPTGIEDAYRYIHSFANRCPSSDTEKEKDDPYSKYSFWEIDLSEKFSSDLSQVPLGRRFLYQMGMLNGKRVRTVTERQKQRKRKRTN